MKTLITILFILFAATASAQYTPDTMSARKLQSLKERSEYYESIFSVADSSVEVSRANVPPAPQRAPIRRTAVKPQAARKK